MFGFEYNEMVLAMGRKDGQFIPLEQCALGLCGESAEAEHALKSLHGPRA
jgi:hypothetical protein